MKGKIAYFIPGLKLAGTSTQALAFCDAMHEAGYDVELVASSRKGVFLEAVSNKPYAVHYLHDAKRFRAYSLSITLRVTCASIGPLSYLGARSGLTSLPYMHIFYLSGRHVWDLF